FPNNDIGKAITLQLCNAFFQAANRSPVGALPKMLLQNQPPAPFAPYLLEISPCQEGREILFKTQWQPEWQTVVHNLIKEMFKKEKEIMQLGHVIPIVTEELLVNCTSALKISSIEHAQIAKFLLSKTVDKECSHQSAISPERLVKALGKISKQSV